MNKNWLSLAAVAVVATTFVGCNSSSDDNSAKTISFSEVSVPTDDASKAKVRGSESVTVNGTTKDIGFHTIVRTGQEFTSGKFGQLFDINGNKLQLDSSDWVCTNGSGPDHTTLLTYGNTKYAVTQLECKVGGAYVTKLAQDENGNLSAVDTKAADFSKARGTYVNCAGMPTGWGTHLGSEEYEPDMALWNTTTKALDSSYDDVKLDYIAKYLGKDRSAMSEAEVKNIGYYYGWIWELALKGENMESEVTKHYSMGRAAFELSYVMPDNKTAYMTDDGQNGGLYMYVADSAKNLTAGELYIAKWNQTASTNGGSADLTWIPLGHATDAQIDGAIEAGITFDDMFEKEAYNNGCSEGFTSTNVYYQGPACYKQKSGQFNGVDIKTLASRLEMRLFGALNGGTTEFSKEEGLSYNAQDKKLYLAMSQVRYGMEDNKKKGSDETKYDIGGNNDIKLDYNKCGTVYHGDVVGSIKDTAGNAIDSNYVVKNLSGLVSGSVVDYTGTEYEGNECDINGISNPDNVSFIDGYNTLIIGEDTGYHPNDFIWSMNLETSKLTRILTSPYGAETTSPFVYKNFGGHGYMTTVIQHPFGEISDKDPNYSVGSSASQSDLESYIGYVGPMPAL